METIVLTQLSVSELRKILREEIGEALRSLPQIMPTVEPDEIGGTELARRITGLKLPTIYSLCSARKIPHFKRGKKLYFSRNELQSWLIEHRRRTVEELVVDKEFSTRRSPNA